MVTLRNGGREFWYSLVFDLLKGFLRNYLFFPLGLGDQSGGGRSPGIDCRNVPFGGYPRYLGLLDRIDYYAQSYFS